MKCTKRFQRVPQLVHDSWSVSLIYKKPPISSFSTGPDVPAGLSTNTELNPCKTVTDADSLS